MNQRAFFRLLLLALVELGGQATLPAQSVQPPTPATVVSEKVSPDSTVAVRQQTFELVWRTVQEKHFDPTFGGVNWEQVRLRYAPKITAAASDAEFYGLLQQMLGELHQSHFA